MILWVLIVTVRSNYKSMSKYTVIYDFEEDKEYLMEYLYDSYSHREFFVRGIDGGQIHRTSNIPEFMRKDLLDGEFYMDTHTPYRNKMVKVAGHEQGDTNKVWVIDGRKAYPVQRIVLRKYLEKYRGDSNG